MEGVIKKGSSYVVNGLYVHTYDKLWKQTVDRVKSMADKSKDRIDFSKKMVTRLNRIKKIEKIYYTIAVLVELGYPEVAEMYDSRLVMIELTKELEELDGF